MKVTAQINADQLSQVDLQMTIVMTVAQWRVVREALDKSKDGYYGPAKDLRDTIITAIKNLEKSVDGEKEQL